MSYAKARQIDKGPMKKYIGKDEKKFAKKCRKRKVRNSDDPNVGYAGWCT